MSCYGLLLVVRAAIADRGRTAHGEPTAKEEKMRRKLMWSLVVGAVIVTAAEYVENLHATPAFGFSGTTISVGRLQEFDVMHQALTGSPGESHLGKNVWLSLQKTKGPSDLYVQSNVWAPGGTTGWHSHPGHSLITVTAGAVTNYDADDPTCTPTVYTAGMAFVDHGGDHAHVIRNEGFVEARTTAVQLIPAGATRRIDADANPACPF